MKRIVSIFCITVLLASLGVQVAKADDAEDFDPSFYTGNDILFYDPRCNGGTSSDQGAVISAGTVKSLEEFVDKYGQMAFDVGKKYGIPYEAILAQGYLESGAGNSKLTLQANNFFGIKAGSSWSGETITFDTKEEGSGGTYTTSAAFRKYPTPEQGWDGYGQFITQNQRYKNALTHPGDPQAYLQAIKDAGYATDSAYVSKNMGLVTKIKAYIAQTNKWPPSSEVAKTNTPTAGGGTAPTGSSDATAGCTSSSSSANLGTVVQNALNLAWPNKGKHNGTSQSLATQAYQTAMPQYNNYANAGSTPWTDCGVFVATVVKMSNLDPQYPGRGTGTQLSYLRTNSKWNAFIPKDTSQLQPGDVMILDGHTYLYTGPYKGDDGIQYTIAQASLGDHPPEAGFVFLRDGRGPYTAARLK